MLQSMEQAVEEAASAKKKRQTAEDYASKLKAMLEKHLVSTHDPLADSSLQPLCTFVK